MCVFGLSIVGMGCASNTLEMGTAFLVAGAAFIASEVASATLYQEAVPDRVRGRVMSFVQMTAMSMNPLGFVLAGALGATVGARPGLWAGGGVILLLGLAMWFVPRVRHLGPPRYTRQAPAHPAGPTRG